MGSIPRKASQITMNPANYSTPLGGEDGASRRRAPKSPKKIQRRNPKHALTKIDERHHFPRSWVGERLADGSPPPSDFLWWEKTTFDEPQQSHLLHRRRYPLTHHNVGKGEGRGSGEGRRSLATAHLPDKSLEFGFLPPLSRL